MFDYTCLEYFTQLLNRFECIECIKINLKASTQKYKRLVHCEKCEKEMNENYEKEKLMYEMDQNERLWNELYQRICHTDLRS